jgi:hypothetical protein
MQLIKILIGSLLLIGFTNPVLAAPPFQILRTCMSGKPYNDKITITMIEGAGPADKSLDGCKNQYDRIFQERAFGTLTCQNKFYLVINGKKTDPQLATNMSINPEIKPGTVFTPRALWYKIDQNEKSYLCIFAPLAEQGVGSSYNQYYIVENAFDVNLNPELYFYFLDKNIAPITSKTL